MVLRKTDSASIRTPCRNTWRILELIEGSLKALIAAEGVRNMDFPTVTWGFKPRLQIATGKFTCQGDQQIIVSRADKDVIAKLSGTGPYEMVQVMVYQSDYSPLVTQLGAFALNSLGEVSLKLDGGEYMAMNEPKPAILDLVQMGFLEPESVRNFVDDYHAGIFLSDLPFDLVFGASRSTLDQAMALPPKGRRERALKELASARPPLHVRFLAEWQASRSEVSKFGKPPHLGAGRLGLPASAAPRSLLGGP